MSSRPSTPSPLPGHVGHFPSHDDFDENAIHLMAIIHPPLIPTSPLCSTLHQLPEAAVQMTAVQILLLKQQRFIPSVLEARSPESRCWQGHAPSEGSGEDASWPLLLRCCQIPWRSLARGCISQSLSLYHMVFSSEWLCPSFPFTKTIISGLGSPYSSITSS